MASLRSRSPTCGNSSTPDGARKHLKPSTPAAASDSSSPAFPGTTPPQKKTSIARFPAAAARFSASAAAVVVAGMLLSGMSTIVVTPPAAREPPLPGAMRVPMTLVIPEDGRHGPCRAAAVTERRGRSGAPAAVTNRRRCPTGRRGVYFTQPMTRALASLLALAAAGASFSCAPASRAPATPASTSARYFGNVTPPAGNVLRFNLGAEPEIYDPGLAVGQPDGRVDRIMFEGLKIGRA